MEANELRIGNLAIQPQLPHIAKITAIDYRSDDYYCKFDGIHSGCWCSEIEPIPLTEELLLKCGFSKREPNRCTMLLSIDDSYTISDNICPTLQWWIGNDYVTVARSGIGAKSVKCNSLHQLQNLYYALTGKELEVQL